MYNLQQFSGNSVKEQVNFPKRIRDLNQHYHMSSFPLKVHFGQRNLHLCICIVFSQQKDKIAVRTCFNFKCITEYTVKFLYKGHDVFDIFIPLLMECTEFLWNINWHCSVE